MAPATPGAMAIPALAYLGNGPAHMPGRRACRAGARTESPPPGRLRSGWDERRSSLREVIRHPEWGEGRSQTRGFIISRVFAHDVSHITQLNEALAAGGLPIVDLWGRSSGRFGTSFPGARPGILRRSSTRGARFRNTPREGAMQGRRPYHPSRACPGTLRSWTLPSGVFRTPSPYSTLGRRTTDGARPARLARVVRARPRGHGGLDTDEGAARDARRRAREARDGTRGPFTEGARGR